MTRNPNIILINCDDLGYGDLACYGSRANDTPYVDALCREGLMFTDFYAASPVCSPSRAALMTGCYPPRVGFGSFGGIPVLMPGHPWGISHDEITLPQMLQGLGYTNMIVGKWHCGDQNELLPTRYGFHRYFGLPYSNDMGRQVGEGRPDCPPLPLMCGGDVVEQQPDQAALTERYTVQAISFMRENKNKPFFLYFAHMHTHMPHYALEGFMNKSRNGEYGAAVGEIDWSLGRIRYELKALGLEEDTLIIFTSDNGSACRFGASNAPLRSTKATCWEGGQRVPSIWHWPGRIKPGVTNAISANMDIYATLAHLLGGQMPPYKTDSIDLYDTVFNHGPSARKTFLYYWMNNLHALRHGPYKLHVATREGPINALYNLQEDIAEENNIYAQSPEIVAELTALMDEARLDLGDELTGQRGSGLRRAACVASPKPLTVYDPAHPYIVAMYDKDETG